MQPLPHSYQATATGEPKGEVSVSSANVETIITAPPAEFGGPGNRWSPESLLVAAIADCYILTFRSIAAAAKLEWLTISCDVTGKLERKDGVTKFTEYTIRAQVKISGQANEAVAIAALEKTEAVCLIVKSLTGTVHLDPQVTKAS